ncbi:beta strand repeat-containing protein [Pedosphaera parvula]|uniref:Autotransporter-associated beta strand repeat protein n=1 Tax=Pedosphaera parvula (strain Ellin514) TaxID=320771 RepID=B9XDW6_PEDPL|nr:LamG domain-containing protein [Pedosphaera parvula]EEF61857.1 autotransporter-associated beta strand repeat protein [Pedosphaera parvula Ellin514]
MKTIRLLTATIVALVATSPGLSARADITTGLVGYWSLADGPGVSTVTDLSGNNNNGALLNYSDATFNNMWTNSTDPNNGWPFGLMFTNSLAGFGTNTYVNVADSPSLNTPTANKAWTLSAWVNCSVVGTSEPANAGIISKGLLNAEAYALYINSAGKFEGCFHNVSLGAIERAASTTIPAAGTWYHVTVTVLEPLGTANAEAILYVNGVRQSGANANTYTTVYGTNLPVTIGARAAANGTVTLPFQGTIDEVRIYNRALSATDVAQLYNNKAFALVNNGIGSWNGLGGSGGNATLDATSHNFCTNVYTAPVGTAATLLDLFNVEQAASFQPGCVFADTYYSNGRPVSVATTNLTIATGGIAIGTANGAGTMTFLNAGSTYTLSSSDGVGLKDGPNPTSMVQSGTGTAILTGINTFSGGLTINSGTVQVGNGGTLTGQELGTAPIVTDNGAFVFNGNNSLNFTKTISGTGSLTIKGSITLTLNPANTYSGDTTIINSTLSAGSLNDSASSLGSGAVNLNGATLLYTSASNETTGRQFNGTAGTTNTIDVPGGINLELSGRVTSGAAWLVNKTGAGTLTLSGSGDNSSLGMNVNAGTVILNKSGGHAIGNPLNVAAGATVQLGTTPYDPNIFNGASAPVTISSGGVFDVNGQPSTTFNRLILSGNGIGGTGALINSAASTSPTLTTPITLAADTTVGGAGNMILPAIIGGNASLVYAGSGVLLVQGINAYSGATIINSGTVEAAAGAIPGNVVIAGTGVLQIDTVTSMSSVASLTLPGSPSANTVNLNFAGTQTIGLLVIGTTSQPPGTYGAVGSGAANTSAIFTGPGILNVSGQANWDPTHLTATPGSGGTGSWDDTTHNWFTGGPDTFWPTDAIANFAGTAGIVTLAASVNADELAFATSGYVITNMDGISVLTLDGNNPTISVPTGNTTVACTIAESGANPIIVTGPGTLSLSGINTYAGGTVINGSTLKANTIADANCSIGPSGPVTMLAGSTLSYTGGGVTGTSRNVTGSGSATCYIDVPAGSLTLSGQVRNGGGNSAQIFTKTGAGTLVLDGSVDNPSLTMAINQGVVIINKASASNVHGLGGGASTVGSGAKLQLSGTGGFDLFSTCVLTVNSGGVLDLNSQNDNMSTLTLSGTGIGGSGALINSAGATTSTLTNGGSGVVLTAPTTIGGQGNITLASKVSGSGVLTYAGTGTLTLTNANTFSGGTTINPGGTVVLVNSASSGGTGAITDNGTLNVGIVGNNVILANTISGPGIVNISETANNNLQLGGSMSGFTGTINCPVSPGGTAKAQILTTGVGLTSAATVNIAAGGTLYVANPGVTIASAVNIYGLGNSEPHGALRMENGALISGPVTLYGNTTMGNGQSGAAKLATISGPISQSGGAYGITFTAEPGTIVLSGTNTYTGPTTISGGVLVIGGAGQLGSGSYAASILNNANFSYASSASQILSGVISGTGALTQSGPGLLNLSGTNTYTGNTLITNSSMLLISGSGCLGVGTATNYAGNIGNYGSFTYASSSAQTLSGVISGTGMLTQSGSGTLTLSGANTYTGATLITNNATLALATGGSINTTPSISIAAGATFDVSAYSSYGLPSGVTLGASGTGTVVGSTAATIKGAASSGATITLTSPLALIFKPQTFNGDANHPALFVSQISQGQLILSGSSITINNSGSSALGAGVYSLIQAAPGAVISVGTPSVTVTGAGLAPGATASLSVNGSSVNLVVSSSGPKPSIGSVTISGGSLIFSGSNGSQGGTYTVLATTNVALPLSQWTRVATNSFSPTGNFNSTNVIGANPQRYFSIEIP